jgi:hypothetical protein
VNGRDPRARDPGQQRAATLIPFSRPSILDLSKSMRRHAGHREGGDVTVAELELPDGGFRAERRAIARR